MTRQGGRRMNGTEEAGRRTPADRRSRQARPFAERTAMKIKYLLVEDNEAFRNGLANELSRSSSTTEVLFADDGEEALEKLHREPDIDIVVLDLTLNTDMYGLGVLSRIREFSDVIVVMLTSDKAPERQTEALERGADGYMYKSTFKRSIQIRRHLETILKRHRAGGKRTADHVSFEGWAVDTVSRRLRNPDGADVTLSRREFDLLLAFVENPQILMTQEALIDRLNMGAGKNPQAALSRVLSRLRKKLDKDRRHPFIRNVYGQGFTFTPSVRSENRP